jgi:lipoic acid synthetase
LSKEDIINELVKNNEDASAEASSLPVRKPDWLKTQLTTNQNYKHIKQTLRSLGLHTVCEEAKCPNLYTCFSHFKTATLMILGDVCTRHCFFCSVKKGRPAGCPPVSEAEHISRWVKELGLRHLVLTMVTRDDLADGGAAYMAAVLEHLHKQVQACSVEVLCSDFKGEYRAVAKVLNRKPAIFAHNLETVRRLTPKIRPEASYERSLQVLHWAKELQTSEQAQAGWLKSGLMLGLGESKSEVLEAMADLRAQGVDILVLGQYLQPGKAQYPVQKYWHPDEFSELKEIALRQGFRYCEAGPLGRYYLH